MTEDETASAFDAALAGEDAAYLDAETALRTAPAEEAVRMHLTDDDPVARLLARAVLDDAAADESPAAVLDAYLDAAEVWFAPTIVREPPVRGVVANLSALFGDRLTGLLAVRLVKVPAAAVWRARVALAYLGEHPTPAVTEALVQYAATTTVPGLRLAAVGVLTRSGDPQLAARAAAERDRLARQGRELPAELRALLT